MVGEVFQQALRNGWIDSRAQFGMQPTIQPYEWVQDRRLGWSTVRQVSDGVRKQWQSTFQ
jgi:hypothetical protein